MKKHILSLAAALTLSAGGAMAQLPARGSATPDTVSSVAASTVGHWLHDPQGNTIGSVRWLADGGRTAVIMVGSYFEPGSHEARVPAGALSVVNGKATLQTQTIEALNTTPRQ